VTGKPPIRVGGASGYWGDAALATPQLLASGDLDFLVYDYLAEITMSILARARAADPEKGYATDFVTAAMAPNLSRIAESGVRVIANAGGVNPAACAAALRSQIEAAGLALRVGVVEGDDLLERAGEFAVRREMFTGEAFPPRELLASINAYLGAFPIAAALDAGADIVITGRCVDSAVTLGACIHAFGWGRDDLDCLAQGSLAGHLLECGTQATGGNFTDWEELVDSLPTAGYPIAEIHADGHFEVAKAADTGGRVSVGTVGEQMLYEIGDPAAYVLPDVICDLTRVRLEQVGEDRVAVHGARGCGVPADYKVCATWADGFRAGQVWTMVGRAAPRKARHLADAVFERSNRVLAAVGLEPLADTSAEVIGAESHYGSAAAPGDVREVDIKIAARHPSARGVALFLKEMVGLALTAPPGLTGFAGARPKPMPVLRLFSCLLPKASVPVSVSVDGVPLVYEEVATAAGTGKHEEAAAIPTADDRAGDLVQVPLECLAFGRSGDKGNRANIGVMARRRDYLPWIAKTLTEAHVAGLFDHFLAAGQERPVERFYLPGTASLNFLLHDVLGGGGVASLRADPQGKVYAQLLLGEAIALPRALAERDGLPTSAAGPTQCRTGSEQTGGSA
jgi:hypothetical protein